MNAPGQIPSQADMLQRVAGIAPLLSKTAPDSEQQRTLCADAVSALHREGLFRLWTPREVGGYDLDLDTHVMVMLLSLIHISEPTRPY